MEVFISRYLNGAENAEGTAVIIDVFRAFSTACYAFAAGAGKILLAESDENAFLVKKNFPGAVIAGERGGLKIEGFDYGNSPSEISRARLRGRTLVLRTSAGTRGLLAAGRAEEAITGSFVNASAAARYLLEKDPAKVSLVCMGWDGSRPADEDELCAEYIRGLLAGEPPCFENMERFIREESSTMKFTDVLRGKSAGEDLNLCLSLDRFGFVLRARGRELERFTPRTPLRLPGVSS